MDRTERALARLGHDRRHGASEIARAAFETLALGAGALGASTEHDRRKRVERWGRLLRSIQPAMGALVVVGDALVSVAQAIPAGQLAPRVRSTCRAMVRRLDREPTAIVRAARPLFPPHARVVTISRSSTLLKLLASLRGAAVPQRVTVLRSLPGGEGAAASRDLHAAGLPSRCVDDGLREEVVAAADLVLVGADTLYRDGSIAHKVGTRSLAESAERWHVPVIVVTGLTKLVPGRDRPPHPLPPLFDRTPARLVREYWTDLGRWTRDDVARAARTRPNGRRPGTTTGRPTPG
jgi:translation initiation factor eIF-2B subunit delta